MSVAETPATPKGNTTRERIVRAARRLLIERGHEAFVMRELADELQIKLGNLQYYFKTRDVLILHVIELEAAQDRRTVEKHLESGESAVDVFRVVVQELVSRWRGNSGALYATLNVLSLHNRSFAALRKDIYARFYAALEALLLEMNATLTAEEAAMRVRLITALIDGSALQSPLSQRREFLARVQQQAEALAMAAPGGDA